MTTGRDQQSANDNTATERTARFNRRRLLLAGAGIGVGLSASALLAACGGDDDDDDASTPTTGAASVPTAADTAATASDAPATAAVETPASAASPDAKPTEAASPAASGSGWTFTDGRGITVELDRMPTKIIAEVTSAATLWGLGIRPVGIYGVQRDESGAPAIQAGDLDLDSITSLGEEWGVIDVEALLALGAELIVDQDWGEGIPSGLTPEALALLPPGIPSCCINVKHVSIVEVIEQYEAVAEALGADMEAPELVAARDSFDASVANLQAAFAARPGVSALFGSALTEGLYVAHPDESSDTRFYKELGLDIVEHPVPEDFWELLSWEQVNKYPVDVIFLDARAGYERPEEFAEIGTWEQLPAVVADQVAPWYFDVPYTRARVQLIFDGMAEVFATAEDVS